MMNQTRRANPDALLNCVLILIGITVLVGTSAYLVLGMLARLAGAPVPVSLADVIHLIFDPAHPGIRVGASISPVLFWGILTCIWIGLAILFLYLARSSRVRREQRERDPEYNPYLASRTLVKRELSGKALLHKARFLRPDIHVTHSGQLGWMAGTSRGIDVYIPFEEAVMLASIARIGKGRYIIIPAICAFDGAVLTTSVRADNINTTWKARAQRGPIAVFAPLGLQSVGADADLASRVVSFSLISGCSDPVVAVRRSRALVSGLGSGVESADFWESRAAQVLAALLAAADLSGESIDTLTRWASSMSAAHGALDVLSSSHDPDLERLGADLASVIDAPDERTAANQWVMVSRALAALAMGNVRESVDGASFDIESFIRARGTFYIVVEEGRGLGPLANVIIEEFWHTAMSIANHSPGGRCEPPLFFAFDELVNVGRPPSLMAMATAGGGSGITTLVVVQSMEQARAAWGVNFANGLWDAVTTTIIQGGLRDEALLRQVAELSGEHIERRRSLNYSTHVALSASSSSISEMRERNITPASIRAMSDGKALLIRKNTPIIPLTLLSYDQRTQKGKL